MTQKETDEEAIHEYTLLLGVGREVVIVAGAGEQATLKTLLDPLGVQITCHDSGTAAIRRIRRQPVDLLICQLELPDLPGEEVFKVCREDHPQAEVLVLTPPGRPDRGIMALHQGAFDFLTLPFEDLGLVVERIKRALEKNRLTQENTTLSSSLKEANRELNRGAVQDEAPSADPRSVTQVVRVLSNQATSRVASPASLGKQLRRVIALLSQAQLEPKPTQTIMDAREELKRIVKSLDEA